MNHRTTAAQRGPGLLPNSLGRRRRAARQRFDTRCDGFTLLELLVVISLIATLMALLFGAATLVRKAAQKHQGAAIAPALQVAIANYRHEFGQWPVDPSLTVTPGTQLKIPGTNNFLVFDMLRASSGTAINPFNTNNLPFIDNSTVMTTTNGTQLTPRHLLPSTGGLIASGFPIAYQKSDGSIGYYSVTIDFEQETVEVNQ